MASKKQLIRINALNGVKGLFIFLVVFYHNFKGEGPLSHIFTPTKLYGGFIVNYLFFMLSGFLTAYSFSKVKQSKRNFLDYLKNKLKKLYPLYAITNIMQIIANIAITGFCVFNLSTFIIIMTMQCGGIITNVTPYNYPTWFLCSLLVCFAMQYAVRYFCKDDPKKYIWCFYLLLALGISLKNGLIDIPFLSAHGEGFANFFLGCIIFEHYRLFRNKKLWLYLLWVIVSFMLIYPPARSYLGDVRYAITFIFCPAIIVMSLEEPLITRFLCSRPIQHLGRISMYIFFLHATDLFRNIPAHFSNYYIGYAVYLLTLIAVSSLIVFLTSIIASKYGKKKRRINQPLSYAEFEAKKTRPRKKRSTDGGKR